MAKFIFELQNILNIKEKLEEQKKMELGTANKKLTSLLEGFNIIQIQRNEYVEDYRKRNGNILRAIDLYTMNNGIKYFDEQIIKYQKDIEVAEAEVEKKREELKEALFEKKKYEVLKERAYERFIEEEKIEEKKVVDEIINYKYRNR